MAAAGLPARAAEPEVAPAPAPQAAADAKAERPFLGGFLHETRVVYPLQVGEWSAIGEHLYEQQELGVSVRYVHGKDEDRWIDLYFYPAGVLPDGAFARMAAEEREGLRQARLQAGMPEPELGELRTFSFLPPSRDGKAEPVEGYSLDLAFEVDGQRKSSAMTLLLERMYLIKGRFSAPEARLSRNDARQLLEGFMAQLQPRVTIESTGECWMPMPIERLAPGQPPPDNPRATYGKEGPSRVYVLDDRVLAPDPDSIEARIMMTVGMMQHGRLFPGCVGSDPQNPVVPEGMREIRLEYRAPTDEAPQPNPFRVEGSPVGNS